MSEIERDGFSAREMYLMREAMNAASYYESLEQWLDETISDAGHYVAQHLASDADRLYGEARKALDTKTHHIHLLTSILIDSVKGRDPDFVIGNTDDPYLIRWWLRRDRAEGSIYLHQIRKSDDDSALHDHPWPSTSIILSGTLREVLAGEPFPGRDDVFQPGASRLLTPGSITSRGAEDAHRLEVVDGPVWSLFITGKVDREWGFHCPGGWVHWKDFTDPDSGGTRTGRGCGEQNPVGSE